MTSRAQKSDPPPLPTSERLSSGKNEIYKTDPGLETLRFRYTNLLGRLTPPPYTAPNWGGGGGSPLSNGLDTHHGFVRRGPANPMSAAVACIICGALGPIPGPPSYPRGPQRISDQAER